MEKTNLEEYTIVYKLLKMLCHPEAIQEHQEDTALSRTVRQVRKVLDKNGRTNISTFAAACFLVNQVENYDLYKMNEEMLEEDLMDIVNYMSAIELTEDRKKELEMVDMAEDIANVTGHGVSTDIPFKPKVKVKPEDLTKSFLKMYEEIKDPKLIKDIERRKRV